MLENVYPYTIRTIKMVVTRGIRTVLNNIINMEKLEKNTEIIPFNHLTAVLGTTAVLTTVGLIDTTSLPPPYRRIVNLLAENMDKWAAIRYTPFTQVYFDELGMVNDFSHSLHGIRWMNKQINPETFTASKNKDVVDATRLLATLMTAPKKTAKPKKYDGYLVVVGIDIGTIVWEPQNLTPNNLFPIETTIYRFLAPDRENLDHGYENQSERLPIPEPKTQLSEQSFVKNPFQVALYHHNDKGQFFFSGVLGRGQINPLTPAPPIIVATGQYPKWVSKTHGQGPSTICWIEDKPIDDPLQGDRVVSSRILETAVLSPISYTRGLNRGRRYSLPAIITIINDDNIATGIMGINLYEKTLEIITYTMFDERNVYPRDITQYVLTPESERRLFNTITTMIDNIMMDATTRLVRGNRDVLTPYTARRIMQHIINQITKVMKVTLEEQCMQNNIPCKANKHGTIAIKHKGGKGSIIVHFPVHPTYPQDQTVTAFLNTA